MPDDQTHFMRLAIEQMQLSEHGQRRDPAVGAVLVNEGGAEVLSHRGQGEKGRHAEYVLLEHELKRADFARGATLYTTLEPCTSRSHNKKPCAEWIVWKGIGKVVIGMLDPNPTICGRGYWHLADAGIEVEFFPTDLAKEIRDLNEEFIDHHRGGMKFTSFFAAAIRDQKGSTIAPYPGMGIGDAISLQDCPQLREGWALDLVELQLGSSNEFEIPSRYQKPYQQYFEEYYDEKGFKDDGTKLMLIKNPAAFEDSPSLVLPVKPTRYSVVQFYRDNVATVLAERDRLNCDLIEGSLNADFPHSFCMHVIVVTSDRKILVTKRSPKVAYDPRTWSVSIEEQLKDIDVGCEHLGDWGKRTLKEELGLEATAYHKDNFRLLSIFLEADLLNISMCAYVDLNASEQELDNVIRNYPRTDYEFTNWAFVNLERDTLLREIFHPRRAYHRTSRYRMLLTFLKCFGAPDNDEIVPLISESALNPLI